MSRYPARFLGVDLMAAKDIDGLCLDSVRINLSRGSFNVSSHAARCGVITSSLQPPPHHHHPSSFSSVALPLCLPICLSLSMRLLSERVGTKEGRGKTSQYKVAFKNLSSSKSNSTMTPARLSCTVSKVSVECLTQAVGFVMGLFSQRLT